MKVLQIVISLSLILLVACKKNPNDLENTAQTSTPSSPATSGLIETNSDLSAYNLFLDFGIHRTIGNTYKGQSINGSPYFQQTLGIGSDEYAQLANNFNAAKFDAAQLVQDLKMLGVQTIVFPAKNIDGFALYNTQFSDFKSSRDFIAELSQACEEANINFGIQYSLVDWHLNKPNEAGHTADLISESQMTLSNDQVAEIFTNYTSIDILHFTHGSPTSAQCQQLVQTVKNLQPNCKISGLNAVSNDIIVLNEPIFLENRFDLPWTYLCPFNPGKEGLTKDNNDITRFHIRSLLETRASGGTIMYSLPLSPSGVISNQNKTHLNAIGDWITGKSALVYNSSRTPFGLKSWGNVMVDPENHRLFINIINWPDNGQINLYGLNNDVNAIYPINDNTQQLPFAKNGRNMIMQLEGQFSKEHDIAIIVFEYIGTLDVVPIKLAYAQGGTWKLTTKNALIGNTIAGNNSLAASPTPNSLTWHLPPTSGGTYDLTCNYSRHELDKEIDLIVNGERFPLSLDNSQIEERPEAFQTIYGAFFLGVPSLANQPFTMRHGPTKGFPKSEPWGFNGEIRWSEQSDWNNGDERTIDAPELSSTYVYQSMYVEADQTMLSVFKLDDGVSVWSNGDLVAEYLNTSQREELLLEIPTRSGNNQLMYKFYNTDGDHTIGIEHNTLAALYVKALDQSISIPAGLVSVITVQRRDGSSEPLDFVNFSIDIAPADQM